MTLCGTRHAPIVHRVELLRTKRLLLRNWEEPDLDAFFDLYAREDVIRWLGRHPRRALASGTRRPVGTIPLLPLADDGGPTGLTEVGWHLHPDHQGRGLATEAAQAVLAAAAQAGIEQVLALTDLDNGRSQAVATRLGMHDEGITQRWFGLTTRQFRKVLKAP
jgi:RimJ/RimL family protein N-acetyltransferase